MRIITLELIQELFEFFGRVLEPLSKETPKVTKEGVFNFFVIFKEGNPIFIIVLKESMIFSLSARSLEIPNMPLFQNSYILLPTNSFLERSLYLFP